MDETRRKAERTGPARIERLRSGEECGCPCDCGHAVARHDRYAMRVGIADDVCVDCPCIRIVRSCHRCAGMSLRDRVKLAAFCGDVEARNVTPDWRHLHNDELSPSAWISLLSVFPRMVQARAAQAACWLTLADWEQKPEESPGGGGSLITAKLRRGGTNPSARLCLEAGDAWLACPCYTHEIRWAHAYRTAAGDGFTWAAQLDGNHIEEIIWILDSKLVDPDELVAKVSEALIRWVSRR